MRSTKKHNGLYYLKYINGKELTRILPKKTLIVGTDCSGIEAPIQALNLMGVKFHHAFSSDIDEYVRENINHNYDPDLIFDDITTRDHSKLPKLDLYIAGFPCQTFSMLGKRMGFDDEIKGTIFFDCHQTIQHTSPTVFILENVKGLINHNGGRTFDIILNVLRRSGKYNVDYFVLNTLDYGIPQNRERVFIVGIKKLHQIKHLREPTPVPLEIGITDILDNKDKDLIDPYYTNLTEHKIDILSELIRNGKIDSLDDPWLVNLNVSKSERTNPMLNVSPTLLAGNGGDCIYYLTSHRRRLTPNEYLRLQGFHDFESVVPRTKLYKQIGNSMSVNVLVFLFQEIFKSVEF